MATQSINGSTANGGSSGGGGGGVGTIPVDVALTELNETVSRLASHKGVETVQILNRDGDIITESSSNPAASITVSSEVTSASSTTTPTTNQATTTATPNGNDATQSTPTTSVDSPVAQQTFLTKQAALTKKIMDLAGQYLHNVDGDDEVSFIQIRSKSGQELLIAPHEGYVLAVHKR